MLLALERNTEAYSIIQRVLGENPWFKDFQEFYDDQDYVLWLKKQGGKTVNSDDILSSSESVEDKQDIVIHAATNRMAVYWNDEIHFFDLITGQHLHKVTTQTYDPFTLRFSKDGSKLLTSGWDQVSIWNVETGKQILRDKLPESNSQCAGFARDDAEFFADQEVGPTQNLLIKKISSKRNVFKLKNIGDCSVSGDNKQLAVVVRGGDQHRIAVIDLAHHKIIANLLGNEANPYDDDFFFVQNNQQLLVRDFSDFYLWNIADQSLEYSWNTVGLHVDEVAATDQFILVVDGDKFIKRIWYFGLEPGPEVTLPLPEYTRGGIAYGGVVISEDKTKYAIATHNRLSNLYHVFILDLKTDTLLQSYTSPTYGGPLTFVNNDTFLVLGGYPIQVLDLKSGSVVHQIKRP